MVMQVGLPRRGHEPRHCSGKFAALAHALNLFLGKPEPSPLLRPDLPLEGDVCRAQVKCQIHPEARASRYNPMEVIKDVVNQGPKIITAAAKSPSGVIALTILALSVLGYTFFNGASESVRVWMFALMFFGYMVLCVSVLSKSAQLSRASGRGTSGRGRTEERLNAPPISLKGAATISLRSSTKRLSIVWGIGCGIIFALLLAQLLFGGLPSEDLLDYWAWIGPVIIPPVSCLVIGVACSFWDGRKRLKSVHAVCMWLSVVYLLCALSTILLEPMLPFTKVHWVKLSTLILTPFEGILVAMMALLLSWTMNESE